MERPEPTPAVIEDAVEDHAHPSAVSGVEELAQRGIATEQRVDRQVVVGVIPMVGGGLEDRCEVERGDAEVLEVAQVLSDPEQVTALEPVHRGRSVPGFEGVEP